MRTLFAALALASLAACSSPTAPKTEKPELLTVPPKPTCPPGQRPYVIWNGPGRGISWVCGPA